MALLFMDGFSHYATADLPLKWDGASAWAVHGISTTQQRRAGSKSLQLGSTQLHYVMKTLVSADDTIIYGFAYYLDGSFDTTYGFVVSNAAGIQFTVVILSNGAIEMRRGAYNGTLLGTSAVSTVDANVWNYIEVKVKLSDAAGTYDVVVNGVNVLTGSGVDTQNQAAATFDRIALYGQTGFIGYVTDMYVADSTGAACNNLLGDSRVDTVMPDGAGNYAQWDPSAGANYECADDPGALDNDTTYVSTDVLNEIDTYTFGNLAALGTTIHGVAVVLATRKDDAGTIKSKSVTRISATDYLGAEVSQADAYDFYHDYMEVNPHDAAAWEEADINGAEFGIKLTET